MLFDTKEVKIATSEKQKSKGAGIETHIVSSLEIGMQKKDLENAISLIQKNHAISFATKGAWSAHHLLEYLLRQIGSCEVILASWAFSEQAAKTVQALKEQGFIKKLTCYLDNRISVNAPKAKTILERAGEIHLISSHSKMILLKNEEWFVTVVMSANFSANRRLETGVILTEEKNHAFFKKALESAIKK